jgi:hypothetical protein
MIIFAMIFQKRLQYNIFGLSVSGSVIDYYRPEI